MNSIEHIIRIIAESREQLRSESCRRSAMSEERTILPKAEPDKHLEKKSSPSGAG